MLISDIFGFLAIQIHDQIRQPIEKQNNHGAAGVHYSRDVPPFASFFHADVSAQDAACSAEVTSRRSFFCWLAEQEESRIGEAYWMPN